MGLAKIFGISAFGLTIGGVAYWLRKYFSNPYLYVGLGSGAIVYFLLNWYFNGGKNKNWPNLNGKVIVITGANTGLGYESCRAMAKLNPKKIILACRSEERATKAILKIKEEINVDILEFMRLDLNDLHSVKEFAENFKAKYSQLDILLNNAGIMAPLKKVVSA